MIAQDALARSELMCEMIKEERDRLLGENVDLKLQMKEMKQTLEKERAVAIEDRLKKDEENDLLNQRVVADCETRIHKNLEKISKKFQDEQRALQLKVDELEKMVEKEKAEKMNVERDLEIEKEASKAELEKKDEELSRLTADNFILLMENHQLKDDEKDLQDKVNLLEVEASQASSLNNEQQEKITNLENELQASKIKLNTVANVLGLVNGKQRTDEVAPLAPVSSQSFNYDNFDGFSTEDQQPLGAEPLNASKNLTNEEVDAEQVSKAAVPELSSFSRERGSSNGSSFAQVPPVSEEAAPPIVNSPSRITPVSQTTGKRRASSSAATHPVKKTKKNSRKQENDDSESNSDEADNYNDSEETTTGRNRNNILLRSRNVVPDSFKRKFTANEYEIHPSRKHDKVVVLAPGDKCYSYHYHKKGTYFRCYGCSEKHKKYTVYGTIERDDNGKEYFWANDDHVCELQDYTSTTFRGRRVSKTTIKIYGFELAKNRQNGVKIVVPVMKNDRKMCYFFYVKPDRSNSYVCGNCKLLKHFVSGKFGKDEDGKEYFETPNDHVCEPCEYKPAEIIKAHAHQSKSQP